MNSLPRTLLNADKEMFCVCVNVLMFSQSESLVKSVLSKSKQEANTSLLTSSTYLSITPCESPLRPRLGANESSSSKKIMQGAAALALANTEEKDRWYSSCIFTLKPATNILIIKDKTRLPPRERRVLGHML